MARNKYPEETVNLILDTSVELFLKKGYDNTSIQDIVDCLGGLSKGAIYHHFKSKEAILIEVYQRLSLVIETQMVAIRDDKSITGLQKLQKMFMSSLSSVSQREILASSPNLLKNPRLLAIQMESIIYDVVPNYIEPVINEGMADGSIVCDYPKELSQVLILLSNIWINPLVYTMSDEEIATKIAFFRQLTESLGLSIIDQSVEHNLKDIKNKVNKK